MTMDKRGGTTKNNPCPIKKNEERQENWVKSNVKMNIRYLSTTRKKPIYFQ
jgi:hypothetical protein